MKAIIYCRVSTKEQAEKGFSLEGQEKECRKFALNNGYEVDKVFVEAGESAKTQDRTQLKKLIEYCVKNKKTLQAIIIWKYDRLARNLADQTDLVKNFSTLGIRLLSATETNDNNAAGKMMRNIIATFAQFENDVKAERTINGMKQAIEQGRWPWKAPVGYKQTRDQFGKPLLCPTDDAAYIKEIFQLAESGLFKQVDIAHKIKKQGFKRANKNVINRILTNPTYAGLLESSFHNELKDGIHQPIISKETFWKVQQILTGKRPSITPKNRNHPDFPLRRFIRCPKCDEKLTGSWSTGRKGIKYAYYHCRMKGCVLNVKKHELEDAFYNYLKTIQPKPEIIDLFNAIVLDVWKNKQSEQIKEEYRIDSELKILNQKKDRIDELMINGTFDEVTYKQKAEEIRNEILIKEIERNEVKIDLNDIEACLNYCKYFLSNVADLWAAGDLDLKQRFQALIFPEKIYYEKGTFRTTATALIFKQLQDETSLNSCLVAPTGFEPVSKD